MLYYFGKDHTIQVKWNFKCQSIKSTRNFYLPPAISPELNKCPGSNPVTGVLQGDVLVPFLFIILVDYLLKKATSDLDSGVVTHPRRSRGYPMKVLNDLDFADDIALLEFTIPRAQVQLTSTATAVKDLGLIISVPKTEYMTSKL